MNVSLTPEFEKFIEEKIASGMYLTASEVVRDALRMLKNQDEVDKVRLEHLKQEIAKGLQSLKEGRAIPADKAYEELRRRSAEYRRNRA